jgi:hypothetical protein
MIMSYPAFEVINWRAHEHEYIADNYRAHSEFRKISKEIVKPISRLVFGAPFLLEKIMIFDNKLDDMAIEFCKFLLFQQAELTNNEIILFDGIDFNNQNIGFVIISESGMKEVGIAITPYLDFIDNPKLRNFRERDAFVDYRRHIGDLSEDNETIKREYYLFKHKYKMANKRRRS